MRNKAKIIIIVSIIILSTFQLFTENNVQKIEINENSQQKAAPWWSSNIVNLLGILIGACLILLQSWIQHKNSMELQQEDYRNKYRLEIYNEISKVINKAIKISAEIIPGIMNTKDEYLLEYKLATSGIDPISIKKDRVFEVANSISNSQSLIIEIIFLIEKYEIVILEFRIFKNALTSINYDINDSFTEFRNLLFKNEPIDQEKINMIENSIDCVAENIATQMGYLSDLQIELQNKLLIKLFKNEVLKRKPSNPNVKVISTDVDQLENLKEYFDEKNRLRESKKKVQVK